MSSHAETSAIVWQNQTFMYYRSFINADTGQTCPIPQGIALATSSNGGTTWQPVDGGKPLPALRTVQAGQHCTQNDAVASTWVYAPDVIVDGSRLVMAFEQRDLVHPRALHSVRWVTSTDGRNWSGSTRLLAPGAVGAWDDEVGTPDVEKDGSQYVVTFHGHDSSNRIKQTRAMVRMSALVQDYSGARTKITLSPSPAWAGYGVGMSDMRKEADGYWYIIFEAFSGASGACGRTDTATAVGIARSANVSTWTVRSAPLISGRDGLSCGWDMPAWLNVGATPAVVTPNDPPENVPQVRWNVIPKVASVAVTSGTGLLPNQYLPVNGVLTSPDGSARLVMQTDGNLVLYRTSGGVIWASDTNGLPVARAYLQYDGNLVLQQASGAAVRASATDGRPGATFRVNTNGVSIDAYGRTIWSRLDGSRGM
jgi:hypothetical protein